MKTILCVYLLLCTMHSYRSISSSLCRSVSSSSLSATLLASESLPNIPYNLLTSCNVSVYSNDLCKRINCIPLGKGTSIEDDDGLVLIENQETKALQLVWGSKAKKNEKPFSVAFQGSNTAILNRGKNHQNELICKAFGSSSKREGTQIIDLTGGLGRDSFILASAGYVVTMIERNPVLYLLLSDAIVRLRAVNPVLAARMNVFNCESTDVTAISSVVSTSASASTSIINVYLDPMYASNGIGKKALVKKETQMLHRLVQSDEGDDYSNNVGLLKAAVVLSTNKIVVKRSINSPPLVSACKPHDTITGSTHRFDVYYKNRKIDV